MPGLEIHPQTHLMSPLYICVCMYVMYVCYVCMLCMYVLASAETTTSRGATLKSEG